VGLDTFSLASWLLRTDRGNRDAILSRHRFGALPVAMLLRAGIAEPFVLVPWFAAEAAEAGGDATLSGFVCHGSQIPELVIHG
jgi:hypothetical protein